MINFMTTEVLRLYDVAHQQGVMNSIWSTLTRQSHRLLDLEMIRRTVKVSNRHYIGLQTVCIKQIRGSEGRSREFDNHFRPLKSHTQHRWVNLAVAHKEGRPLPPVDLIQIGDIYFVRDGHHRISVAQAMGQEQIEAAVTVWETRGSLPWKPQVVCNVAGQYPSWARMHVYETEKERNVSLLNRLSYLVGQRAKLIAVDH